MRQGGGGDDEIVRDGMDGQGKYGHTTLFLSPPPCI